MELARERGGLTSCRPSTMEPVLAALLFLSFCDNEGNLVPNRDVKPLEGKSPARCRLALWCMGKSRSPWALSAKSYSGDEVRK